MGKSGEKLIVISNINNIFNNKNNYLFEIKKTCKNKKIICFGASIAGKYAVDFFLNNFKSEVLFFIDKDKKKHIKNFVKMVLKIVFQFGNGLILRCGFVNLLIN